MEIKVSTLPATLINALQALGYHKATIEINAVESIETRESPAFVGNRSVVCAVNLGTGERRTLQGSWGGPTMFAESARNPVDSDDSRHVIPVNGAVIKGESGGRGAFFRIYVRPDAMPAQLGASASDAPTDREKILLSVFRGLKSFARSEAMQRNGLSTADVDAAIAKGWLTRNKAGAVSLTSDGKVIAANHRVNFSY